jgi:hypothetical protein
MYKSPQKWAEVFPRLEDNSAAGKMVVLTEFDFP